MMDVMLSRRVLGVVLTGAVLLLAGKINAAPLPGQSIAFRQALAEAAATDREIAEFYRETDYRAIWTDQSDAAEARRQALVRALSQVERHGLPMGRYDLDGLMAQMGAARSLRDLGQIEVVLSQTYLRYARDVQTGILVPSQIDEGIKREVIYRDRADFLREIATGKPRDVMRALPPQSQDYARLMKEKLRLEQVIALGDWGAVVPAETLKPGQQGAAVVALRDRLIAMGYLDRSASRDFDARLQQAVQAFQSDHGLDPDGVVGASTMAALNMSAAGRLKSVIVAMERERWLVRDRGARHILVNLTDFSARILDADIVTFRTRAVVGLNETGRRSPEFSDQMEYMVVNPTWHVPRSIAVKEYLPQMQRNPNAAGHLRLYDSRGREVSRAAVDFGAYSARSFPFAIKQPPSERNALGLVKFMFPNKYNIYLHDTPQKALFDRDKRDFSHGCIRLQQPFDFAYALLSKQESNPEAYFQSVLNTKRETYVYLDQPVPVHIIYRTAFTQAQGRIQYRGDVYGRDAKIWDALERLGVSLAAVQG